MADQSHLDQKYFINPEKYNCPFCNRNHVSYSYNYVHEFDWTNDKACWIWRIDCDSCSKTSMHLTFDELQDTRYGNAHFRNDIDIDSRIFYSVPSSFFTIDDRIPAIIRDLISEADSCIKMNFMTGASACTRKAIYELLVREGATGDRYDDKIESLKESHNDVDPELFDVLAHIKDMTSDKVHEQSWDKWDTPSLKLILETTKTILHEIYVVPDEKTKRKKKIRDMKAKFGGTIFTSDEKAKESTEEAPVAEATLEFKAESEPNGE